MSDKKSYHDWNPSWKERMDYYRYTSHTGAFGYEGTFGYESNTEMQWTFLHYRRAEDIDIELIKGYYIPPYKPYRDGYILRRKEVISFFNDIKKDFSDQLLILRKRMQEYTKDPSEVVKQVEILNQIIDSIEAFNNLLIGRVKISRDKQKFLDHFKITEDQLIGYKIHYMDTDVMHVDINKIIDENFDDILATYKRTKPPPTYLTHDNSTSGDGRHISPGIVNITDVIAVNPTCDVIDGSYSASDNSTTAQQVFILYSFTPREPPGFLIVQEPINPVFLRCHNPWLSSINFKLVDQSGKLIDTRAETININLLVKS